jgi:hypothetical protein
MVQVLDFQLLVVLLFVGGSTTGNVSDTVCIFNVKLGGKK